MEPKNIILKCVPSRIQKARIINGYSRSELATLVGVTPQAISLYELGSANPSDALLLKMSDILGFPEYYFFKPIPEEYCAESVSFFRRNRDISVKQLNAYEARASLVSEVFDYLCSYVDFPEMNIPNSEDFYKSDDTDLEDMDDITNTVRQQWHIPDGPVENLSEILQNNGFIISRIEYPNRKVDSFSNWINGRAFIYLNSQKSSVRDRFDMAHEFGHLLLHAHYTKTDLTKKELYDRIESQANMFASSLLLQTKTFLAEPLSSSIDRLLLLKKKWKVAVSAMVYKIKDFEALSPSQIDYLYRQMSKRNMQKGEPFDDIAAYDNPDILRQAIEVVLENNFASPNDIIKNIAYYPSVIESICGTPKGFLGRDKNVIRVKFQPQVIQS